MDYAVCNAVVWYVEEIGVVCPNLVGCVHCVGDGYFLVETALADGFLSFERIDSAHVEREFR